jgi:hypothetical protein
MAMLKLTTGASRNIFINSRSRLVVIRQMELRQRGKSQRHAVQCRTQIRMSEFEGPVAARIFWVRGATSSFRDKGGSH